MNNQFDKEALEILKDHFHECMLYEPTDCITAIKSLIKKYRPEERKLDIPGLIFNMNHLYDDGHNQALQQWSENMNLEESK